MAPRLRDANTAVERIADIIPATLTKKEFTLLFRVLIGRTTEISRTDLEKYYGYYEQEMNERRIKGTIKTAIGFNKSERDFLKKHLKDLNADQTMTITLRNKILLDADYV